MSIDNPVSDFMQRDLLQCAPQTPVGEAAERMREARCGSIVVMAGGVPVGIWTESDALMGDWRAAGDLDQPISACMKSPVRTVGPNVTLGEASRRFRQERVRHLLVVDDEGRHLGMISETDVVRHQGVAFFLHARRVSSVLHNPPLCVEADLPFDRLRLIMVERQHDAVVVRRGGELGIVTPRDVIGALAARRVEIHAGELASFPLQVIRHDATLFQARDQFAQNRIRHLGVVDEGGALVGLLSFRDILDSVEHEYVHDLLTQLERQTSSLKLSQRQIARQASLTEAILNALPINVFVKDEAGRLIVANEMVAETFGRPLSEIIGRSNGELLPSDMASVLNADDARVRAGKETLIREEQLDDGRILLAQKRLVEVDGLAYLIGVSMDVTDWKRADALMVSSHHILQLIAAGESLPVILDALCRQMETHLPGALCSILLLDEDGIHLRHGAAPHLPLEYSRSIDGAAIGDNAGSCGTAVHRREQVIVEDIASSPLWEGYRPLAETYGLRACWSTPFLSSARRVLGAFAIYYRQPRRPNPREQSAIAHATRLASIAVERWRQIDELRRLATTDPLTGLFNRSQFMTAAETELRRSERFDHALAVLMADLDHFKRINDRFGHAAGDEALRLFCDTLRRETRSVDLTGRLGGEEFAVVLPETGREDALQVAERVRAAVEAASFVFQGGASIRFTVSLGAAVRQPGDTLDSLLARADRALYAAKNGGRNRVESD